MRYPSVPILVALAVTAACSSDPVAPTSSAPPPSFSIGGNPTVLTLVDEGSNPLAGQVVKFKHRCGGSWAPEGTLTTDGLGQFTVTPTCPSGNWDDKVTVTLNQASLEQNVTVNTVFQAARVNATLKSCTAPIAASAGGGGQVHQGTGSWVLQGNTGTSGTVSFYMFPTSPGSTQVRMTYNHKAVILTPAIVAGTNQVDFLTTEVTLVSGGAIWSNTGGSWWQFVKPSMDLLPGTYNFYNSQSTASSLVAPLVVSGCEVVYPAASDNDPPVVTNVAVTPNPAPFTTASYALTADATDNEAVTEASYTVDGGAPVPFVFSPGSPVSLSATLGALGVGVYDVCVTAEDAEENANDPVCTELTVTDNEPPVVTNVAVSPNPAPFSTASYALTADATDNEAVTAASYTIEGGAAVPFVFSPGTPVSLAATLGALGVGVYDVCVTAEDAAGNDSNPACTELTVTDNQAPVVTNVAVSPNPAAFGTAITLTATATDNVGVTTAFYTINLGNPEAFSGFILGTSVSLSANLGTLDVGVYDICVTAKDAENNTSNTECTMLAVYDPTAGFVTGGGWINSPAGAYVPDADLVGKATFGFVSKYLKGRDVPSGNTQFQFKAGDLNFSSTSYEWLVVSGARAQFKGAGTINGAGDYRFMLTVIDGQISGGGGTDKFRIRIWDGAGGGLVYDNMLDAPDAGDPTTVLGGGSIVIHVPRR